MVSIFSFSSVALILLSSATMGAWVGRECCESAVTDQCRSVCLESDSREDLSSQCRSDHEEGLYSCVFKRESKHKCCGKRKGSNSSKACHRRCNMAFQAEAGPTQKDINDVFTCDAGMAQCMKNFTDAARVSSIQSMHCCNEAKEETCKKSCKRILQTEITDRAIVERLVQACGDVIPHEPIWKCFLQNSKNEPTPQRGPWSTELQCCSRAQFHSCKQLCKKVYENAWPNPNRSNQFEQQCKHNTQEVQLKQCLDEVTEPCQMGCSDLSFCTNFNNRATSLFRSCNAEGDKMARDHFNTWSEGMIRLPFVNIPVKDIQQCEPEKWKAVVCALQIKPCSSRSSESIVCNSDCMSLLNKCVDRTRFPSNMKIEDICEMFSPSHFQDNCISLSTYSRPGKFTEKEKHEVTQPCNPNPCADGQVCIINRNPCHTQNPCPRFKCQKGCKIGHGSTFAVSHGSLVRVPDVSRGESCFKSCVCAIDGALRPCTNLPCMDESKSCKLAGQTREHGSNFKVDCNFCSCYSSNVTCTTRQCSANTKEGIINSCSAAYQPVCGNDGRTYPSICVAERLGQKENVIAPGSCLSKRPCHPNPCKRSEKCIPTPRVCLTNVDRCHQYECLPPKRRCLRLLRRALPPLKQRKHPLHRNRGYQNILSSSHFFSNSAILDNNSAVCDVDNEQHDDICQLRKKRKNLGYLGWCQTNCGSRYAQAVCGQDRVTYNHSCMADANGVLIDHLGPCRSVRVGKDDEEKLCVGVACPPLSNSGCSKIRPPGSCCSLCGGMLRVLISSVHLNAISQTSWNGPITVRDIVFGLRRQLHVLECNAYGLLTSEGDIAIIIVSTKTKPSLVQEEACQREAERLAGLINKRSPTLTSYLVLSPLTAATLSSPGRGGACRSGMPDHTLLLINVISTITYLIFQHRIT